MDIFTTMITPYHADGSVDYETARKYVDWYFENGLTGIEGYYTDYTDEMADEYRMLAKKYGLKLSGGTDFHGTFKPHISIGSGTNGMVIPYTVLEQMRSNRT